ncbi:MAG TPA: hypothetical protein V6D22_16585 [Candidatus Obscuribacterales bacterium]
MFVVTDSFFDLQEALDAFFGLSAAVPLIQRHGPPGTNTVTRTITLEELTPAGENRLQSAEVVVRQLCDADADAVRRALGGVAARLKSTIYDAAPDVHYRVKVLVDRQNTNAAAG